MSSFRIDRQYVSFQTAETQPVFATREAQKPKPEVKSDLETFGGDISKIYDEIYEKLLREHSEQAENILSKASDEARELVEKAKKQSEELLITARSEAEKLEKELRAALDSEMEERLSESGAQLRSLETSLREAYAGLVDSMTGEVVSLVMEIARKVINVKLSQSDEVFMGLVRDALERLKQTGSVVIRVGPEDYARYFGAEGGPEFDTGEMKVAVQEEPEFKEGDLVVESEGEIIDLSLDRQLDQIEQAFLN
jgi:flagellar assembly protein FliH